VRSIARPRRRSSVKWLWILLITIFVGCAPIPVQRNAAADQTVARPWTFDAGG
jgi:hypothetical protein